MKPMDSLFPAVFLLLVPAGLGITVVGLRNLVRAQRAYSRALKVRGTIVRIEFGSTLGSGASTLPTTPRHPVVRFPLPSGGTREFRSEYGSSGADFVALEVGHEIDVLYDPQEVVPPVIAAWWPMWSLPVVYALFGPMTLAFAGVLWLLGAGESLTKTFRSLL
jgi:hypothetical protein